MHASIPLALARAAARRWGIAGVACGCTILAAGLRVTAEEPPPPAEAEAAQTPPASEPKPADTPPTDEPKPTPTPAKSETTREPSETQPDAEPKTPESPPAGEPADTSATAERRGPTDPRELEAFLDGIIAAELKDNHIAGATISVVVDNRPFFSKGYGFADVETNKPVDPDTTMFRIGSVSKLFTWTAVMQLAEEGKLDLDADVNTYLEDFKIPQTFSEPITLKHLLSHTPGFEDHVIGLFGRGADKLEPLGTILARDLPARVRKPGELASYSNHGTALAGYIVAQVSGMSWEDYVEQRILQPLGMQHTLVRQPAEDKLPAEMSKGYDYENGRYQAQGFEYVPIAPAGSMSASAGDMARFIIAHLQDGRYDSTQILKEETARQMREQLFTHDKHLDGMAYGFMLWRYNGERIVEHGGDTFVFHSMLAMLPERKVGLFFSYNTSADKQVGMPVLKAFLDRYFPATQTAVRPLAPADKSRLERCAGEYGGIRHSYTTMAKLGKLLGAATVAVDDDQLVVSSSGYGAKRFVEIEPLVFREVDGQDLFVFREDGRGRIANAFSSVSPHTALVRLSWYETPTFTLLLLAGCAVVFLSAAVGWPWAAFITRGMPRTSTGFSRLASVLAWVTSLAILAWMALFAISMRDPQEVAFGLPAPVDRLLWATPAIAALVAVVVVCGFAAWLRGYWRFSARLHYTCVLAAGLAFVWFLAEWNLLGVPAWPG